MNKFSDLSHSAAEVLDLTHDHALPFRLQFDDHSWRQHLNSLKPLGLAILLNTCNMDTQEHYMQFCCHVTCEALYNEDLVPVTNRRYVSMSLESHFRLSFIALYFFPLFVCNSQTNSSKCQANYIQFYHTHNSKNSPMQMVTCPITSNVDHIHLSATRITV